MKPAEEVKFLRVQLQVAVDYCSGCLAEAQTLCQEASELLEKGWSDSSEVHAEVEDLCARGREFIVRHPEILHTVSLYFVEKGVKFAHETINDYTSRFQEGKATQAEKESVGRVIQELLDSAKDLLRVASAWGGKQSGPESVQEK